MASSRISSSTGIKRKSLRQSDQFTGFFTRFFEKLSSQAGIVFLGIGGLLILGLGASFWMNHREAQSDAARSALFLAEKSIETELKALAPQEPAKTEIEQSKAKANNSPSNLDLLAFQKFDVDAKLAQSVKMLKAVEQNYSSTRQAFEARFKLGSLYFDHGDYAKALPWFQKAVDSSSGFERATALSSLGYTYENLAKHSDAIQTYEKAINLGESSLKGDLLLGIARCYEAIHDLPKARSTYDQILKDLPGTDYSRSAELFKAQLQ